MALPPPDEDPRTSQAIGPNKLATGATAGASTGASTGALAGGRGGAVAANAAAGPAQGAGQAATSSQNALYDAADTVIHGAQGAWDGLTGALDDTFSAEQVKGPAPGQWGAPGTVAAGYNQGALARGSEVNAGMTSTANNLRGQATYAGQRAAPTTNWAGADRYGAYADSSRNVANNLVNQAGQSAGQDQQLYRLNQFANSGPGPSQAQAQLQAAQDANQRSALSLARSGRGAGDSASALRDAAFTNAQTGAQTGQAMAQLRAQEEAQFRQQQLQALEAAMGGSTAIRGADTAAAQVAQGTRAQDIQAQGQAMDRSQFDTQTQQTQTQLNDSLRLGLNDDAFGYTNLGQQTELDYAQLGQNALNSQADYELQQQQMALDAAKANQSADLEKDSGLTGLISSGVGAVAGLFSDERAKDLEQREAALADALETVGNAPGYSYRYKNPGMPGAKSGRMVGPMAQDIERGPLGDSIVSDTPQGKMVDPGRLEMVNTSAITELNHKVKALEEALGRRVA